MDQSDFEKENNLTSRKHSPNPQVSVKMNHTDHSTIQHISTIVNGETSETPSSNVNLPNAKENSIQTFINELRMELTNQLSSYSVNKKHKIVCIGDSHTRGFSTILTNLMCDNFDFYSVVKPGSNSNQLLETARQEIKKLSSHDALVICSGTNDIAANKTTLAFQNISKMMTRNNHTHIILINVPHRYDTTNTNTTNNDIEKLKKKTRETYQSISPCKIFEN